MNASCPGYIDTPWSRGGIDEVRQERLRNTVIASTPVQGASTAEDLAGAAVFLASPAACHVTVDRADVLTMRIADAPLRDGRRDQDVDPYSAFTGTVALDGSVGPIEHVGAKAAAAAKLGHTRLFVPTATEDEATQAVIAFPHVRVIPVRSIAEAWSLLTARHNSTSQGTASLSSEVRRAELDCVRAGLKIYENVERQGHVQLNVTDNEPRLTDGIPRQIGGHAGSRREAGNPPAYDPDNARSSVETHRFNAGRTTDGALGNLSATRAGEG